MQFISLAPFVPSGEHFESAKDLFKELGFNISWDAGDYVGFKKDDCSFILQNFDNAEFAANFMISVNISSAAEFWQQVTEKKLAEKFGIRIAPPTQQPYGIEVNVIDMAGVCWHFVE
ncbi:hypothetical protein [Foetidibacter luteolus]|uniref:hypothetical protein n=1 Tax=Foetidibacter luteolus TaxID=2608880 RepID=UPI00129B39BA|nr:hypothetical protein [Foetidibacter luteolus]